MSGSISFRISAPEPHSHLFAVEMKVGEIEKEEKVLLRMPVWTPGSYLVREYARHVQNLEVVDQEGRVREANKVDKASWEVETEGARELRITYEVYAHDLTVRTNHLDGSHGFFNCVATCLYPEGRLLEPVALEVVPPEGWEVFCGLKRQERVGVHFQAQDYDELFDTPVEIGDHRYFDFEVEGVDHRFLFWGEHNFDVDALKRDVPKIVAENAAMFGEIPYERYVFINHMIPGAYGGLEHRHSSVNVFDARGFDSSEAGPEGDFGEKYTNFLRLLCHEHFHAYHVKRLRPKALGPFDYQRENYTRALWAVEGVTSYYDTYNLLVAELISAGRYVELLEKRITQMQSVPGRHLHSLEEAGFDAWIKLYRPDENTRNSSVSYYLKGEVVTWLLDLYILEKSEGERSMADALRRLWREYYKAGDIGFPPGAGQAAVSAEAGADATEVFDELVRGRGEIEWKKYLEPFGLALREIHEEKRGWLGLDTMTKSDGRKMIKFVVRHSPAEKAGLYAGDEIVAIDGWGVRGEKIREMVSRVRPGDEVRFHLIRRSRLIEVRARSETAPPKAYRLERLEGATGRQDRLLKAWLGTTSWEKQ